VNDPEPRRRREIEDYQDIPWARHIFTHLAEILIGAKGHKQKVTVGSYTKTIQEAQTIEYGTAGVRQRARNSPQVSAGYTATELARAALA